MPLPSREPVRYPEGFDPEKHCGALNKAGVPCMRPAGAGIPDYHVNGRGGGRCSNHGGRGGRPIIHGGYSQFVESFGDLVEEMRESPDLLDLKDTAAWLKVVLEHMKLDHAKRLEEYYEKLRAVEALDLTADEQSAVIGALDLPPPPQINSELVRTLERVIKSQHDMDYAKQHSIPKREIVGIIEQINEIFAEVCDAFDVGEDAKRAFAKRLRGVQISRDGSTSVDVQRGLKYGDSAAQ